MLESNSFHFPNYRISFKSTYVCILYEFGCPEKKVVAAGHNSSKSGKSAFTSKILHGFSLKVIPCRGEIVFFPETASQAHFRMAVLSRLTPHSSLGAAPHAQPWLAGRLRGDVIRTSRSRKPEGLNVYFT